MVFLLATTSVFAAKEPQNGRMDPRLKIVTYSEHDVVVVHGHYGYSTRIEFAPDERVTYKSSGDTIAW